MVTSNKKNFDLLDILKKNENYTTCQIVFGELHKYIVDATSTNPQFYKLKNMGDLDGEFFFVAKN